MLDPRLDESQRMAAQSTDVDWRNAFLGFEPDTGSLAAYPEDAAEAVGAEVLTPCGWGKLTTVLEPMRRCAAHDSEMISEAREGEILEVLMQSGDWALIRGEDLYVGWVHSWSLREVQRAEIESEAARLCFRYGRPHGTLWISDHRAAGVLHLGTPLLLVDDELRERNDQVLVATASGGEGWLRRNELMGVDAVAGASDLMNLGFSLIGTPYRWGGRSPLGFDCSGFTQFLAAFTGVALPRDAAQQERLGVEVGLEESQWKPGDNLFFGSPADHVGIYAGAGRLLHCQQKVQLQHLGDLAPLRSRLSSVRRWDASSAGSTGSLWMGRLTPHEGA